LYLLSSKNLRAVEPNVATARKKKKIQQDEGFIHYTNNANSTVLARLVFALGNIKLLAVLETKER